MRLKLNILPTFKCAVNAGEREARVTEFEDDVGATKEGGESPNELPHVTRVP